MEESPTQETQEKGEYKTKNLQNYFPIIHLYLIFFLFTDTPIPGTETESNTTAVTRPTETAKIPGIPATHEHHPKGNTNFPLLHKIS